jgi:hypothetical protein
LRWRNGEWPKGIQVWGSEEARRKEAEDGVEITCVDCLRMGRCKKGLLRLASYSLIGILVVILFVRHDDHKKRKEGPKMVETIATLEEGRTGE